MNLDVIREHPFASRRLAFTAKDTCLYALGVGVGSDPLDPDQLRFLYEENLQALPTMAAVIAHPSNWLGKPEFAVDYSKILHGEQHLTVHKPLPGSGEVQASYRVAAVVDKGAGKGALLYFEKIIADPVDGELFCTVLSTLFLRGDGGCGSFGTPPAVPPVSPSAPGAGAPDFSDELTTAVSAAVLYRLNGDLNPLHIDPAAAVRGGFSRPILHGLCTYGVVGYLLVRAVCGYDPTRLRSMSARFSSPVFPGEAIRLRAWRGPEGVHFDAVVPERNQVVLSQGFARIQ